MAFDCQSVANGEAVAKLDTYQPKPVPKVCSKKTMRLCRLSLAADLSIFGDVRPYVVSR